MYGTAYVVQRIRHSEFDQYGSVLFVKGLAELSKCGLIDGV